MAAVTTQAFDKYGAPLSLNKEEEISTGVGLQSNLFTLIS